MKEVVALKEKIAQLTLQIEQSAENTILKELGGDRRAVSKLQAEIAQLRKENETFYCQEQEFKAALSSLKQDFEDKLALLQADHERAPNFPAEDPDAHSMSSARPACQAAVDASSQTEPADSDANSDAVTVSPRRGAETPPPLNGSDSDTLAAAAALSAAEMRCAAEAERAAHTEEVRRLQGQALALQQALERRAQLHDADVRAVTEAAARYCAELLRRIAQRERAALAELDGRVADAAAAVAAALSLEWVLEVAALIDRALALASSRGPVSASAPGGGDVTVLTAPAARSSVPAARSSVPAAAVLQAANIPSRQSSSAPPVDATVRQPPAPGAGSESAPAKAASTGDNLDRPAATAPPGGSGGSHDTDGLGWAEELPAVAGALVRRLAAEAGPVLDARYGPMRAGGEAVGGSGEAARLAGEADARLLGPIRAAVAAARSDGPAAAHVGQAMLKARLLVAALAHTAPQRTAAAVASASPPPAPLPSPPARAGGAAAADPAARRGDRAAEAAATASLMAAEAAAAAAEAGLGRLAELLRGPRPATAPAGGSRGVCDDGPATGQEMAVDGAGAAGQTRQSGSGGGAARGGDAGTLWMGQGAAAGRAGVSLSTRVGGGGARGAGAGGDVVVGFKAGTPLMVAKQVRHRGEGLMRTTEGWRGEEGWGMGWGGVGGLFERRVLRLDAAPKL